MREFLVKEVICILSIYSIIVVVISLSKPNVMDEIGEQKIYGLVWVPEIEEIHDPWEWMFSLEMGARDVGYKEEYLREDVSKIWLVFFADNNNFDIGIDVILSEPDKVAMYLAAHYDYEKKELIFDPVCILQGELGNREAYRDEESVNKYLNRYGLTRKDVQRYQDYAIYGVVVRTWTKTYRESYWLKRWELKSRVVDNTFRFEEDSEGRSTDDETL